MTSSNNNWVCFSCRYHKREAKTMTTIPQCIHCKQDLYCLGYKIPVPKKHKIKEWEVLACCMYATDIEKLEENQKSCVTYKHKIEREVELLIYEKADTKENRKRLKSLRCELEKTKG